MNEDYIKKIIALKGRIGKQWLKDLPQIIKTYEQKWDIKCSPPFPLSYNYVAPAKTTEGKSVVLKISFPENNEFIFEMRALKFFKGIGAIQVLQEDLDQNVVLLEKVEPGQRISEINSFNKQTTIVSDILKLLHKPIILRKNNDFPTVSDWAKTFERYKSKFLQQNGPFPKWMIDKAEDIFIQYPKDNKETVLLHGDLHSDNILSSERGWLIIDPKGIIGEREFELGAYLRNPYYDLPKGGNYKKIVSEIIIHFSEELGFEKERILNWAFAGAVISLLWFLEDENTLKKIYIQNAELLNEIKF